MLDNENVYPQQPLVVRFADFVRLPNKASDNINDNDAIHWILKNKMTKVAKELIIKCDIKDYMIEVTM